VLLEAPEAMKELAPEAVFEEEVEEVAAEPLVTFGGSATPELVHVFLIVAHAVPIAV
jgi:hypothetical protein